MTDEEEFAARSQLKWTREGDDDIAGTNKQGRAIERQFHHQLRRNPKCRSKLPKPVSNERDAFCARGCHTAFYRKRCLVCEGPIERSRDDQKICRKAKCRSAWRARTGACSSLRPLKYFWRD